MEITAHCQSVASYHYALIWIWNVEHQRWCAWRGFVNSILNSNFLFLHIFSCSSL